METYKHLIISRDGLHARIAVYLAKICRDAESTVEVRNKERRANGKEVFSVMNLYANQGDELEFWWMAAMRRRYWGR
mgnify:CR=1 FL=1